METTQAKRELLKTEKDISYLQDRLTKEDSIVAKWIGESVNH